MKYLISEGFKIYNKFFDRINEKYSGFPGSVNTDYSDSFRGKTGLLVRKNTPVSSISVCNKISTSVYFNVGLKSKTTLNKIKKLGYMGINREVINSEYEWYLQKSLLSRMYEMYTKFSKLLRNNRIVLTRNYIHPTPVYEESGYIYGNVVFKNETVNNKIPVSSSVVSEKSMQINKKIETENNIKSTSEIYNIVHNNINVDHIAAIVGKDIESRLRAERLKKGIY